MPGNDKKSWWQRLLPEFLTDLANAPPAKLREAAGVTIDADEDQWRRLSGDVQRDLFPMQQLRMQRLAAYLWEANPLANRLIELPLAFLLAEGVKLTCKNDERQKTLNRFWRDPINNMPLKLAEKVRELALFGEQCYPVFVNAMSGQVRLGYLDPQLIATVAVDPDNPTQPIGVVTVKDRQGKARRWRTVINGVEEECFTARTVAIRKSFEDGECFYFRVNALASGRRGRSDLLAQADWLDGYDAFLFGELDRARFMRAFFWDVEITGATQSEVEARARKITAPSPGSTRVHNESEKWKAEAPNLQAGDSAEHARLLRNHVLGGATLPEHWYGGGGDVNRAVGAEMGEPTFKILSMRQATVKLMLEEMGRYVLRQEALTKQQGEPDWEEEDWQVVAEFPELTARDTTKWAAALQQVSASVVAALAQKLISRDLALKLIAAVAGRLSVEINVEEELLRAEQDALKRAEQDVYVDPGAAGNASGSTSDAGAQASAAAGADQTTNGKGAAP